MNKKGFIFIETLIVIAVLTVSLIMTYSSYSSMIVKENVRIKYNDSAYMYRTYYLSQFLRNFRLDLVAETLNDVDIGDGYNMISGFDCSGNIFLNEEENVGFCEALFSNLNISAAYITYNDLSFIQEECVNSNKGKCEVLSEVREEMANYLKTIGGKGKEGYRIIVEYSEQANGSRCIDECYSAGDCKEKKCKY